ncbi:RNA-binding region-containing protein, putative [Ricinus communis]|uniref:RNA-binding region-containing protein, putative n=1 Tax=Ricinus communis TaxID=3988 RepID=B9T2L9_RICCO|nr:RNA-binding region-containing protein, putative [Ricinus communis]
MNFPFGDTTYRKVFVGGLAWETQSHTLRRHFEQYGDILEAVVISDKNTGRSKGHQRSPGPSFGSINSPSPRAPYSRTPAYHQPLPYGYQPGFYYPSYGYSTYGSEYVYPQGVYNPYAAQQYIQVYGMPGTVNPGVSTRGQFAQPIPGFPGYTSVPNYGMAPHQILQFGGSANRTAPATIPPNQSPHPSGNILFSSFSFLGLIYADDGLYLMKTNFLSFPLLVATPDAGQAQIILSSNSPQFTSGSDQTAS